MAKNKPHRARSIGQQQASIRQSTADAFVNLQARVGFGAGSQQDAARFQNDYISRNPFNLEAAYRTNWLCGMVVDTVAQDMTRAGIEILSDDIDPDDQRAVHDEFERLGLWNAMCDNAKWSRLYGGSLAVLLIDGQDMQTPLRLETVGRDQFKGVIVLDRWQVNPTLHDLVTELGPQLGKPKFYDVNTAACALVGQRIHHTRVIRMDGLDLPWRQRIAENGWGQSVLERLWDRVVAFDSTTDGAAQLVYKAHLRTIKLPGFREAMATGGAAAKGVLATLDMIRSHQSNEGLTVIDGADTFETHQYSFSGLDALLLQFGQQLSGATQIPLVRLFGQSPAGLNSSGDSDLRTYYDGIAAQQDQKMRTGLRVLLDLVHRSKFGAGLPEGTEFGFVSLWQMTAEQKADVATKIADAVTKAADAGLISPEIGAKELRQASRETGVFSHIDDEFINQLESEPPAPGDVAVDPETGQPVQAAAPTTQPPQKEQP